MLAYIVGYFHFFFFMSKIPPLEKEVSGLKKIPSARPGEVDVHVRQVTF